MKNAVNLLQNKDIFKKLINDFTTIKAVFQGKKGLFHSETLSN
jgi:hypothetical protein